jgi:hypothetical protein
MKNVWNFCSDKNIWGVLSDINQNLDQDDYRLLFIDLLHRIKKLETENVTMRMILNESGLCYEEFLKNVQDQVRSYLDIKDAERAKEMEFLSSTGISFVEWVNYMTQGKFDNIGSVEL